MLQARRVFLVSYFVFSEMFYLSWNTIFLKDFLLLVFHYSSTIALPKEQ